VLPVESVIVAVRNVLPEFTDVCKIGTVTLHGNVVPHESTDK